VIPYHGFCSFGGCFHSGVIHSVRVHVRGQRSVAVSAVRRSPEPTLGYRLEHLYPTNRCTVTLFVVLPAGALVVLLGTRWVPYPVVGWVQVQQVPGTPRLRKACRFPVTSATISFVVTLHHVTRYIMFHSPFVPPSPTFQLFVVRCSCAFVLLFVHLFVIPYLCRCFVHYVHFVEFLFCSYC